MSMNQNAVIQPQVSESLRAVAENIKTIASEMAGSRHMRLMDEHANLLVAIRALEDPRVPGRPERRPRRPR